MAGETLVLRITLELLGPAHQPQLRKKKEIQTLPEIHMQPSSSRERISVGKSDPDLEFLKAQVYLDRGIRVIHKC